MNESFLTIIKDAFGRMKSTYGGTKTAVFLVLAIALIGSILYFAGGGVFDYWHQWRTDSKIAAFEKEAADARAEANNYKKQADFAAGQAAELEKNKNAIQKERDELFNRYNEMREQSEKIRKDYEQLKKLPLRLDGLTRERFNQLGSELDKLDNLNSDTNANQ